MPDPSAAGGAATRVVLRPLATPLPLGFLALVLATVMLSAVQLSWIPPDQGRIAGLTALVATVPLQLTAAVVGFLARDPVAATGMGLLAGTWATVALTTLTSAPGATSAGLGVLMLTAGLALQVPAASAAASKLVPAAVMCLAGIRFAVTGLYEITGSSSWKAAAGWTGLALAVLALYAALALELEGAQGRTLLPLGRRGAGRAAVRGEARTYAAALASEPGVRPQL
ncbi:GPR1/FUN34/YaaH family transporter [Blastococcus sp. TF02-8]|uniref:GPR1/FUN34/YaaH family transporter n=1 Tax=Blastococcus sp. TF02-8 TaxID=2250574 RepID=UPI000DEB6577|nr:GPR1/FUN34/YaaH family transporter [Blastococcus sp. TF02-8]